MTDTLKELYFKLNYLIVNPIIALMFALALLFFLYGILEYIAGAADPGKRKTGQTHMLWGFIGLLIMVSTYSIIKIIANTLGVDTPPSMPQ